MALTTGNIDGSATGVRLLMGRWGEEIAQEQLLAECPVVKLLPEVMVEGEHVYVNIDQGTNSSVEWVIDGATTQAGTVTSMDQGYEKPVIARGAVKLGRMAATLAKGKKGVAYFKQQTADLVRHIAQLYGRGIFVKSVYTFPTSGVAAAGTSFTTTDPSGWIEGQKYEVVNTNTNTLVEAFTVTSITTTDGVTYTINHAARSSNWHHATSYHTAYPYGAAQTAGHSAGAMPSLEDFCADANLHNITKNTSGWTGNLISAVGTLNQADVRTGHTMVKRKARQRCTDMLLNSENEGRLITDMNDQARFLLQGKKAIDAYDFKLGVDGLPITVDENCPDGSVFLINKNYIKRVVQKKLGPVVDGVTPKGNLLANVIVDDTAAVYKCLFETYVTMVTNRRNAHCHLAGITG